LNLKNVPFLFGFGFSTPGYSIFVMNGVRGYFLKLPYTSLNLKNIPIPSLLDSDSQCRSRVRAAYFDERNLKNIPIYFVGMQGILIWPDIRLI
jgi:hypothetical protein